MTEIVLHNKQFVPENLKICAGLDRRCLDGRRKHVCFANFAGFPLSVPDIQIVKGTFLSLLNYMSGGSTPEKKHLCIVYAYEILCVLEGTPATTLSISDYCEFEFKKILRSIKPIRDKICHGVENFNTVEINANYDKLFSLRHLLRINNA